MRASTTGLLLLLIATLGLAGCTDRHTLTVAVHPWIGYESLCLAQDLGWLPRQVTLQHGRTAAESLAALQAGTVDAAGLTLDEALKARGAGVPLSAVLVLDSSAGGDMLMRGRASPD